MSTSRALIIGVEQYKDPSLPRRVGTTKALREVELRLRQGGWETRLLSDSATVLHERSGLTQVLDSIEWVRRAGQALLVISSAVEGGRLLPHDARAQFREQSSLALNDLLAALPAGSGLILDAPVPLDQLSGIDWVLCASGGSPQPLFSEYGPTEFLHSVVVALNQCPLSEPLSVRRFFDSVDQGRSPAVTCHNYSSIESISLLTPPPSTPGVPSDDAVAPQGGRFIDNGRYQLLRLLGEGGIGQVYLAEDTQLKVRRAVKLLKLPDTITDDQRAQIRGRMTQAALAAQSLSERTHHVVRVFDIKTDPATGLPFTVMEFLSGETLSYRLHRDALTLDQVFEIGLTLVETMAIAHELKVIHRDLKPENVMLIKRDGTDLFVKLLDFDLVKVEDAQVKTQEGQVLGTLEYMAPEQLKGQEVDERADVFALGAILYECFCGVRANPGRTQRDLIKVLLDTGARPLGQVAPSLPPALCALIDRALSLDMTRRPANARALARELEALRVVRPTLSSMTVSYTALSSAHSTPTQSAPAYDGYAETIQPVGSSLDAAPLVAPPVAPQPSASPPTLPISPLSPQQTEPVSAGAEGARAASKRLSPPLLIALGALLTLGVAWGGELLGGEGDPTRAPLAPREPQGGEAQPAGGAGGGQAQGRATLEAPRALGDLALSPLPGAGWEGVSVRSEGEDRVYAGGRLQNQLARFVYEAHFAHFEGDAPHEAWVGSEEVRWALTRRLSAAPLTRLSGDLRLKSAQYELLISQRPRLSESGVFGEHLALPEGALTLSGGRCAGVPVGATVLKARWQVRGYKKLDGSCEGIACVERVEAALKAARGKREGLKLTLSWSQWPAHERALPTPRLGDAVCELRR